VGVHPGTSVTDSVTLGVDIGGSKTRACLLNEAGNIVAIDEVPTGGAPRADPGLRASYEIAARMTATASSIGHRIVGVGVGVPEFVEPDGVLHSSLVIAWEQQPRQLFEDLAPTVVESDVRCGAIGESELGAGRGARSMLYVSVGTGISCSLVIDGRPWNGHRGEAISLGEFPVDRQADKSAMSTLEAFASGGAMARRYKSVNGAREVMQLADSGDQRARKIVISSATALGAALAWAVSLVDPQVVVLGGGVGARGGEWLEIVRDRYSSLGSPGIPRIDLAQLGADSGVIGAALVGRLGAERV